MESIILPEKHKIVMNNIFFVAFAYPSNISFAAALIWSQEHHGMNSACVANGIWEISSLFTAPWW